MLHNNLKIKNDFSSYCCKHGGSTGVSRPCRQGTGKETCGAEPSQQQVLSISSLSAVPRDSLICNSGSPMVSKFSKGKAMDIKKGEVLTYDR